MPPIEINGRRYTHVERHRPKDANDVRIYQGNNSFVRIGPPHTIDTTIEIHERLAAAGFPVASILQKGELNDEKYFIEASLGEETLRLRFAAEVHEHGRISDASFHVFVELVRRYLHAQAAAGIARTEEEFVQMSHLDLLCEELPTEAKRIREKAAKHMGELAKFPYVLSHGDLSPSNLFPQGIIDLEESLPAPFGYDAVCALTTSEWYPDNEDFEFVVTPYRFTNEQRIEFLSMCDSVALTHGLPLISAHVEHLDFFRAVWLTEGMKEWPKTQQYRHERFVREYL